MSSTALFCYGAGLAHRTRAHSRDLRKPGRSGHYFLPRFLLTTGAVFRPAVRAFLKRTALFPSGSLFRFRESIWKAGARGAGSEDVAAAARAGAAAPAVVALCLAAASLGGRSMSNSEGRYTLVTQCRNTVAARTPLLGCGKRERPTPSCLTHGRNVYHHPRQVSVARRQ